MYAINNGTIVRIGGWGRIIGDPGSGYWLGQKALQLIVDEYDLEERAEYTMLTKEADKKFNITKLNILDKVFHQDFEIQMLAPTSDRMRRKEGQEMHTIIDEAVTKLANHISLFMELTKRKKPIELAFIGSIIENDNIISKKLRSRIKKEFKKVKVIREEETPRSTALFS